MRNGAEILNRQNKGSVVDNKRRDKGRWSAAAAVPGFQGTYVMCSFFGGAGPGRASQSPTCSLRNTKRHQKRFGLLHWWAHRACAVVSLPIMPCNSGELVVQSHSESFWKASLRSSQSEWAETQPHVQRRDVKLRINSSGEKSMIERFALNHISCKHRPL